jgi:hypothetical protein
MQLGGTDTRDFQSTAGIEMLEHMVIKMDFIKLVINSFCVFDITLGK